MCVRVRAYVSNFELHYFPINCEKKLRTTAHIAPRNPRDSAINSPIRLKSWKSKFAGAIPPRACLSEKKRKKKANVNIRGFTDFSSEIFRKKFGKPIRPSGRKPPRGKKREARDKSPSSGRKHWPNWALLMVPNEHTVILLGLVSSGWNVPGECVGVDRRRGGMCSRGITIARSRELARARACTYVAVRVRASRASAYYTARNAEGARNENSAPPLSGEHVS